MTVASIFHFEFWFLWGVFFMPFGCLLEAFWIPRASLGVLLGSFGGALGHFLGSLDVILAAVGCLGGPLGVPGRSWVVPGRLGADFRDFPGNSGRPVGFIFEYVWVFFGYFSGLFFFVDV